MKCLPTGPEDARLMFVAEAPGREEEREGKPLIGSSGQEFDRCLLEAGIDRGVCRVDNVFHDRPPDNKLHLEWCRGKKEVSAAYDELRPWLMEFYPTSVWPTKYTWPSLAQGKYLMPEHLPALQRLREEILRVKPNLVVALGGTPLWALCNTSGIKKRRGAIVESTLVPGQKILPTLHPAYVQRVWEERLFLVVDLVKAKGEAKSPKIVRPDREIWTDPSLDDMEEFFQRYLIHAELIAFDTETERKQISCISFAPSPNIALIVPFIDKSRPGYNYWPTVREEAAAIAFVCRVLALPCPKVAQNGLYDIQYLWLIFGIIVRNFLHDTMLLHHSLYVEMAKDLGFLGSVYTNEAPWKLMRTRVKDAVEKKDD